LSCVGKLPASQFTHRDSLMCASRVRTPATLPLDFGKKKEIQKERKYTRNCNNLPKKMLFYS
jgi:hypothetical protein